MTRSLTMSSISGSCICCILNWRSKSTVSSIWVMFRGAPFLLLMVLRVRRANSPMISMSLLVKSVNSFSSDIGSCLSVVDGCLFVSNIFFIFSNIAHFLK